MTKALQIYYRNRRIKMQARNSRKTDSYSDKEFRKEVYVIKENIRQSQTRD